jgi:hypothetical protein
MTIPRANLIDTHITRWYYCITRCVRRASLLAEGAFDRKKWLEYRLEELAEIFAISVGGFSVQDHELHLLLRLEPAQGAAWSDAEVVRRWGRVVPPQNGSRQPLPVSEEWVKQALKDSAWVATARRRLQSVGWFMKCLKEPLSRLVNREENARGAFFEGRFRSIALPDEESVLATCAYIDSNPTAAGAAPVRNARAHTSVHHRVAHAQRQLRTKERKSAKQGSRAALASSTAREDTHWLCPIENRQRFDSPREGMVEGLTLSNYLLLVVYTRRVLRDGKAPLSREVASIFDRLRTNSETWQAQLLKVARGRSADLSALASGDVGHATGRGGLERRAGEARPTHPSQPASPRGRRTRKDPFEKVWPEFLVWLHEEPHATANSLMARLCQTYPGQFKQRQLRTLQRRIKDERERSKN